MGTYDLLKGGIVAHNLFQNKMGYVGETPWHGLGCKVDAAVTANEMLRAANLDWQVTKGPPPGIKPGNENGRFMVWRDPVGDEYEKVGLGFVGQRYEPLQNEQAFEFFEPFIARDWAEFHTAGALGNGERVWVLARIKDQITVGRNDLVDQYILLSNSHDGSERVSIRLTPVRVVCQNTLNFAYGRSKVIGYAKHTKNVQTRLDSIARKQLKELIEDAFNQARKLFNAMARHRLGKSEFDSYLDSVLPRSEKHTQSGTEPKRWMDIREIHEDTELTPFESRGTLWALYNAIVACEDYRTSSTETSEARLNRVWFGTGMDTKILPMRKAQELLKAA